MRDLLADLLQQATRRGATAADAFVVEDQSFSAQVRLGQVDTVKHAREQHMALRVFVGQSVAAASSSDLSRESVTRLVDEAVSLARVTSPDDKSGLPDASELARQVPDLDLRDRSGHDLSPEDKIELARRCEAAALAADPRITNSEGGDFGDRRARYAYATSHGFSGEYETSSFSLSVAPVAAENGQMQRDYWYHVTRKRAQLEAPEDIGRTAARRTVRRLGARQVKTTEVPVIFDPDMAATLVRHISGAASGPALYRRASFLVGKLGERIAAPSITIVDDGTIPGALGSRPFDGEGLPVRRTIIVEQGVLRSYLLDTYTGRKLGLPSTHHAARDGSGVGVSTTNLYLAAGSTDPAEMIRSVKNGLYVTELIGFGVNGVTGDYSRGAVGLWIENGELAYPVEEITVAGNLLDMLNAVEAVGNDLVFRDRTAAPTLLIGRMTVAGS
ncbi:MAG TPA: TldD/PmbA family protein [Candidatus Dormibacteraeota bacterium]|jgi:PmbA protein|nr:TldD/PmbA family protein [Candidatus Dormibacteraeota bacterium]